MMPEESQDRIDPRLAAAYDAARNEPAPEVDWESLRRTVGTRAGPILRRRQARRFLVVPRPLVPLALAAGIALAVWMGPQILLESPAPDSLDEYAADIHDEAALLEALVADLSEQEFQLLVTGHANPEALLAVAVAEP